MKTNLNKQAAYNAAVKAAYFTTLKYARQQLATIEHEELRYSLIREDGNDDKPYKIIHEFLNPLLFLRLDVNAHGDYQIHYGIETFQQSNQYTTLTAKFIRCLYKLSSHEKGKINIEGALQTDWVLTNCSEAYENIEEGKSITPLNLLSVR